MHPHDTFTKDQIEVKERLRRREKDERPDTRSERHPNDRKEYSYTEREVQECLGFAVVLAAG